MSERISDLPESERAYALDVDHPWEANEHGLWCLNCGECLGIRAAAAKEAAE